MAQTMKLTDILSDLQNVSASGMAKTASAKEPKTAAARDELLKALSSTLQPQQEKTASARADAAPVVDKVVKIASDLAASEQEALKKEASFFGAAFADGCISRFNEYESSLGNVKTASAEQSFEKFAAENPELTKQAVELGYYHGKAQIEQMKKASFEQGYADAAAQIQELSKTAAGKVQLQKIAAEVEQNFGQEKLAEDELQKLASDPEFVKAAEQGYNDMAQELNKLSSDTFERGYNDTVSILQRL